MRTNVDAGNDHRLRLCGQYLLHTGMKTDIEAGGDAASLRKGVSPIGPE